MIPQRPPNLRFSNDEKERCGTCKMYWEPSDSSMGRCWSYQEKANTRRGFMEIRVAQSEVCDSWAANLT